MRSKRLRQLISLYALLASLATTAHGRGVLADELPNSAFRTGVQIHYAGKTIKIPAIAASDASLRCMAVLPPTSAATEGTLVCRVGGQWFPKRLKPGSNPEIDDGDGILFVNLATGAFRRYAGIQPAPDFIVVSPTQKHFAFASSIGWRLDRRIRHRLMGTALEGQLQGSELQWSRVRQKLADAFVGTTFYSIWEVESLSPVWELRYPDNDEKPATMQFVRSWDSALQLPVPWWAIDSEPELYNYPVMAFSEDGHYFVASSERYGMSVLNLIEKTQWHVKKKEAIKSFVFCKDANCVDVFLSNGASCKTRLSNGQDEIRPVVPPMPFPQMEFSGEAWPLFKPDTTASWIATLSDRGLVLQPQQDGRNTVGPVQICRGESPIGVTHVELSKSGRWAGCAFYTSRHPSIDHLRYRDSGFVDRFERIDMKLGRVVDRVINMDSSQAGSIDDNVPTINVAGDKYVSSMTACLSANGEHIIYAVPFTEE